MPLFPELGKQRQMDICEFKANSVYQTSSRMARAIQKKKKKSYLSNISIIVPLYVCVYILHIHIFKSKMCEFNSETDLMKVIQSELRFGKLALVYFDKIS